MLAALAVLLASPAAQAGSLSGNVGAVSDYLFRGLDQSGSGAAVQGGVDYASDLGAYAGLWATNSALGGGNEADVYAGYATSFGKGRDGAPAFSVDAGVIYYAYTEDTEGSVAGVPNHNADYAELYLGGGLGPLNLRVFYTNHFGRDVGGAVSGDPSENALVYATASATLNLSDTISFVPQVGFTSGKGAKDAFGDDYTDYSLTATKKLDGGMSASLALVGTDLKNFNSATGNKDAPKVVVGFKKTFAL